MPVQRRLSQGEGRTRRGVKRLACGELWLVSELGAEGTDVGRTKKQVRACVQVVSVAETLSWSCVCTWGI